jgi:hypothetical protein
MKCRICNGKGYLPYMKYPGGPQCPACHGHGWIPFWTEAERAGLKAMGEWWKELSIFPNHHIVARDETRAVIERTIEAYVRAAREKKEGSRDTR